MENQIKGLLIRLKENKVETLGRFYFYIGIKQVFSCVVLELPNRQNQNSISHICGGIYKVKKRWSKKYGWHYHVTDVDGRELILIHFGNYYTNTRGCILLGEKFADIDNDGYKDITNSRDTLKEFMELAPDEWELTINNI